MKPMTTPAPRKKLWTFGALGAAGCLAGWQLGEGFLLACLPSSEADAAAAPSLVSNPDGTGRLPVPPLPPEFARRLTREGAKDGDIEISLLWHNLNDLDLHCIDPNGDEVYFRNKRVRSGGELDVDMNAGGRISREPVEN